MHTFVKYLVRIPDAAEAGSFDKGSREEMENALRVYAEDQTNVYQDIVFDYRDFSEDAVIFAADDPDAFAGILQSVQAWTKAEAEEALKQITERCGTTDLAQIVQQVESGRGDLAGYYFHCLADILDDRFNSDSIFFDIEDGTPSVTQHTFEKVMSRPEDWAIVIADQHI